ncbi:hypothetical protein [Formosa sp. L2A11]|uniref:hypothetical protein n=1 Tax=Formosa sp. L2A11 TaxID=2686363 RepID=UPI00131BEF33|nr:hypothetical protein [Formosa sp. L2A11]
MVSIVGEVRGADDVENIHVINKTSKTYTITDKNGGFTIPVKLNDTLQFSSIQYNHLEVIIDKYAISNKAIRVDLEELINALDEVIVGNILTGNLMLDMENATDADGYNFYTVGIAGLTGKMRTKEEERYYQSKQFKPSIALGGAGASFPVNSVINGLTGKTKMLKKYVRMQHNDNLVSEIRDQISVVFFSEHPLDEDYRMDFWYFCADDPSFQTHCKGKMDDETIVFLNNKYIEYLRNINSTSN